MGFWLPRPGNARGEGRGRTEGRGAAWGGGLPFHLLLLLFAWPGMEGASPAPPAPLRNKPNCSPLWAAPSGAGTGCPARPGGALKACGCHSRPPGWKAAMRYATAGDGAAANRRGSARRAVRHPPSRLGDPPPAPCGEAKVRAPGYRPHSIAAAHGTGHPRNCHRQGTPSPDFFPFQRGRFYAFTKIVSQITELLSCFTIPHLRLQQGAGREKKPWGGGGKRVLFLCPDPAPSQCQRAVLDEIRNQGQGPSPGPRRSHSAQAKVQGRLPGTRPTHTLLITSGKRNELGPKLRSYLGGGGPPGMGQEVLEGPLSEVLRGGGDGVAARGATGSVSASRRSDTQRRLPVLPSLAREEGCARFRSRAWGGCGCCGWQGAGKD